MEHTNQQLFAEERKNLILEQLSENAKVLVSDLSDFFAVSQATIRADLRDLEAAGLLIRTHGGAIPTGKATYERGTYEKRVSYISEKKRIAKAALGFIEDGDTIAIDTGTTTFELARLLTEKHDLTVVTNDLKIADFIDANTDAKLVLIGGIIRKGFHCSTGPLAAGALRGMNVDKVFMAANSLTYERGFATPNIEQAEIKKAMLRIGIRSVMLIDSHKIGRIAFYTFADPADIDVIITDSGIGKKTAETIVSANEEIELIVV
ncbi:DeoR family transcriptional regulator [Clostridia bacterium]|nr:DeoR family transcriptional regulator [Clostridia bacterium]